MMFLPDEVCTIAISVACNTHFFSILRGNLALVSFLLLCFGWLRLTHIIKGRGQVMNEDKSIQINFYKKGMTII